MPHAPLGADVVHVVLTSVRDTAEHMFLLRAEEKMGKLRFGDAWVAPRLIRGTAYLSSPGTGSARSASERFQAAQYLYDYARDVLIPRSGKERTGQPFSGGISARVLPREEVEAKRKADLLDINVSDEQFAIAFRMSEEARAQRQMVNAIRTEIANLCQDGKLRSFARPIPGGDFVPLPPAFWNTERWYRWFEEYGTSLISPYDCDLVDHYLFLSTSDLDHILGVKKLSATPPESSDIDPYRTGGKGRPTAMHFVEAELHRRASAGQMLDSWSKESEALAKWLIETRSDAPNTTPKAIRDKLAETYRTLKGEAAGK